MAEHAQESDTAAAAPPEPEQPTGPASESGPDTATDDASGAPGGEADEAGGPQASAEDEVVQSAAVLGASASTRRRLRRAARDSLGDGWFTGAARLAGPASIGGGHAVGGDFNRAARDINYIVNDFTARRLRSDAGPIAPEVLAAIRATHVPGHSYGAAQRKLGTSSVVILRGPSRSGKRTTALRLLTELAGDNVHQMGVGTVLDPSSGDAELQEGSGYLAEGDAGSDFAYHQISAWADKLQGLKSYLVVTMPDSASISADIAEHFVIGHAPPDPLEIVRSHLSADKKDGARAGRLLDTSGVAPCVTPHLRRGQTSLAVS